MITTKKMFTKGIIHELIWFLSGNTNIQYLLDHGVHIWDDWADAEGNLGPVYGKQWRSWSALNGQSIDQISNLIERLKNDPHSRRHIISAWNVTSLSKWHFHHATYCSVLCCRWQTLVLFVPALL